MVAASLRRRKAVLGPEALVSLRAEGACMSYNEQAYGTHALSLRGVAELAAAQLRWNVTQSPERGDGIGARLWAKMQVMVLVLALMLLDSFCRDLDKN